MKRTATNLISVVGGEVLLRGANFLAVVVIARLYGAALLGVYATILAFVTVAVMIADNGLQVASITEIARRPDEIGPTLGRLYVVKTVLFAALALVLVTGGLWLKLEAVTWALAAFLAIRTMLYSYCQLHTGALKALDHMPAIGLIQGIHCVLLLIGVALTYRRAWPIDYLLAWLVVCQSLEFLLSGSLLFQYQARPKWVSLSGCWRLLHRTTPIGVTYSVAAVILRADVIVLSGVVSAKDVGYFAAANIPLVMVYVVSWLFGGVILSRMVRLASDPPALHAYVNRWIRLVLSAAAPVCLAGVWIIPQATHLIYGSEYASTGMLAAIMALAVPFILMNAVYLSRAIALESKAVYLGTYIGTGILSLLLDYLLAHVYGSVGVSVAIVIREITMSAGFVVLGMRSSAAASVPSQTRVNSSLASRIDPAESKSLP